MRQVAILTTAGVVLAFSEAPGIYLTYSSGPHRLLEQLHKLMVVSLPIDLELDQVAFGSVALIGRQTLNGVQSSASFERDPKCVY